MAQRDLLLAAMHRHASAEAVLGEISTILRRLPDFLAVLRHADSARVPPPTLGNEGDLQIIVHAILRLLYDDVRPEDPVSQMAGGSSRVDFTLREAGVIVETKMMRHTQ